MTILASVQQANRELEHELAQVGEHVFRLELPLDLAPTLNMYAVGMKSWHRAKVAKAIDKWIARQKLPYSAWPMGVQRLACMRKKSKRVGGKRVTVQVLGTKVVGGGRKRMVVLTRESSRQPDEISCDALGGKMPIDRLVQADVLRGDSAKWLVRVAKWAPARLGEGRVIVDVYECGVAP